MEIRNILPFPSSSPINTHTHTHHNTYVHTTVAAASLAQSFYTVDEVEGVLDVCVTVESIGLLERNVTVILATADGSAQGNSMMVLCVNLFSFTH